MAVINRNSNSNQTESTFVEFDPDVLLAGDSDLPEGEKRKLDASQADEAWTFGAPPPKGLYNLRLGLNKDKSVQFNSEDKFYVVALECRIVGHENNDFNGIPVFAGMSTKISRGKDISTAAALLVKAGEKIPDEATDLEIVQQWLRLLKKEVVIRECLLDWRGGYKKEDGSWQNVFSTMDAFPVNKETGEHQHKPEVSGDNHRRVTVNAQIYVAEWGAATQALLKTMNEKKKGSGASNKAVTHKVPGLPTASNVAGTTTTQNGEAPSLDNLEFS